jgi:hypothetical protein
VREMENKDYSPVGDRSLNFFCHFSNSALAFFCSLVGPNHPEGEMGGREGKRERERERGRGNGSGGKGGKGKERDRDKEKGSGALCHSNHLVTRSHLSDVELTRRYSDNDRHRSRFAK